MLPIQSVSATESFIADLYSDAELQDVLINIPEAFIDQARDAADSFFVDTKLMSRSQFAREDGSADLVRITLQDPILLEDSVGVKAHFSMIMDADGNLVAHKTGATLRPGERRVPGFNSSLIFLNEQSVDLGLITSGELDALEAYAELWADTIEEEGPSAMYTKEHARERLWLVAANPNAIVTFDIELRMNPKTNENVVGINNVAWSNCKLIGTGTGNSNAQAARVASTPRSNKPTVKLPKIDRSAKSVPGLTRRRNRG